MPHADGVARGYGADLQLGERSPASYAASRQKSRGRFHKEAACPTRNEVQRDRDRVLHSTAFRRLMHKTQVFLYHEGDHYRTRLTHSLEVAQIARTIARQLRLDEDLAEALALAHDLGHPPFGHAGERVLDTLLQPYGGFDHNVQSFRIVTRLEHKYAGFAGLNLCWETLEGLIKHNGPPLKADRADAHRQLVYAVRHFDAIMPLDLDRHAAGEAQVAAIADDVAWMTHDIDDGLRSGLLAGGDLDAVPLLARMAASAPAVAGGDAQRRSYEVVRRLITVLIADVVGEARRRLADLAPATADDIRAAGSDVVAFSDGVAAELSVLRRFLYERVYRHPRVNADMERAQSIVRDLVMRYRSEPSAMPGAWAAQAIGASERRRARVVGDFVAGMTDRYAMAEHKRLFGASGQP